jgi:hypothetical protein
MVVTIGIGAAFGVAAAIAVAVVAVAAGFAFEIRHMQFDPGRARQTSSGFPMRTRAVAQRDLAALAFPERVGPAGAS